MPGLITHYICGESVLNTIDGKLKDIINENKNLYNIGCQGPDIFFYNLRALLRKHTKDLGIKMHVNNFSLFMGEMVNSLDKIKSQKDRNAVISYICGYLTHYALDYNTHPYIYYKTGFRRPGKTIRGIKYSVYHRNFETAIDIAMLKLVNSEKPSDKKLWQLISITKGEAKFVADLIGKSIFSAYDVEINGKEVYRSMSFMMNLTRIMRSKKGRRKRIMGFVEEMTVGGKICSSLIHSQEICDKLDYLNVGKKAWKMPYDDKLEFTHSFTEMFDKSCADAKKMLEGISRYLEKEITTEQFLEITGDYSLKTGTDGKKDVVFNYHDIIFEKKPQSV